MRAGTRLVAALAGTAAASMLLAACGGDAPAATSTATATATATAAAASTPAPPPSASLTAASSTPAASPTAAATATAVPTTTAAPTSVATAAPAAVATPAPTAAPPPPPPPPPPAGNAASIEIANFAFGSAATITVGGTVTWTNNDSLEHDVTAKDASFNSEYLQPGKTYSRRFDAAGSFEYLCSIHPFMTGTVTVR